MSGIDHARRQILAWGAAMAGVTLAPGVTLFQLAQGRPPAEPASKAVRWGMLVDANRCASDCDACVTACDKENGLSGARTPTSAQWIRKVELKRHARRSGEIGAGDVPALRGAAMRRRVPDRARRSSAPTASCSSIAIRASAAATA